MTAITLSKNSMFPNNSGMVPAKCPDQGDHGRTFMRDYRGTPVGLDRGRRPMRKVITAREIPPSVHNHGYSATREQAMADFKKQWPN
jgi:hypothetical protein